MTGERVRGKICYTVQYFNTFDTLRVVQHRNSAGVLNRKDKDIDQNTTAQCLSSVTAVSWAKHRIANAEIQDRTPSVLQHAYCALLTLGV